MNADSAESDFPVPGFLPETEALLSIPSLTQLSAHGQVPCCLLPDSGFPLLSYQGSDQMTLGTSLPISHIFQAGMEALFFGGVLCEDGASLHSQMTPLAPRALAIVFLGGLMDVC